MHRPFRFKQFQVHHEVAAQKVSTDSVLLGAWCKVEHTVNSVLDVGAGCGLLALMAAQKWPEAIIDAVEIDSPTTAECMKNFAESSWHDRLNVINADFNCWKTQKKYDLILCNPPYFRNALLAPNEARSLARHTSSLDVGSVIHRSADLLSHTGSLFVVSPYSDLDYIKEAALFSHLRISCRASVFTTPDTLPKLLLCRLEKDKSSATEESCETETINIRDNGGSYSAQYRELTNDFYLFLH